MRFKIFIVIILAIVISQAGVGQDHENHTTKQHHTKVYHHSIALFTGYTIIPEAVSEEKKEVIIVPTIGLDYTYKFNHKIGLSLQNDLELSSYIVEVDHEETLTREYAFISALVFIYEPFPWWSIFVGPGYEFEAHESFFVGKIGMDFIKNFDKGWGVALTTALDIKEVNTSPSVGVTVSKGLGKPK